MDTNSNPSPRVLAGYLPEAEVAVELGLTARTLRLWRQQRRGPPYLKIGSAVLYPQDGLLGWLKSLEVTQLAATPARPGASRR